MDNQLSERASPAADAAGLLVRIGFGLLVLAAPFAALFFRRAFVILVPIGALLIVISALLTDARGYIERVRTVLAGPVGMVALGVGLWIVMSIAWAPFPGQAAERAFRTLGNAAMAMAVCLALPERMRLSNLNLLTLGVTLAAATLVVVSVLGPSALSLIAAPDAPTYPRAAVAAGVLVWPALAWSMTQGRDLQGILLIALCGIAAIASGSGAAAIVLFAALLVFLAGRVRPRQLARILAYGFGGIILLAPLLAFAAQWIAQVFALGPAHPITAVGLWTGTITEQPLRLLTGHGFDTLGRARLAALVDTRAPLGLLPEVWYDLGLPGAFGLSAVAFLGFRRLLGPSIAIAAASLAVASAVILFLIIDPTSTQQWWLSVCVVASITMTAVMHGQYRTRRPSAAIGRAK